MSSSLVRRALIATSVILATACSSSTGASLAPSSVPSAATPLPSPSTFSAVLAGERWIAYQGGDGGPARIRLVRPDGTGDHELTPGAVPGEQFHPDWSHDGLRIAFAVDAADGTRDIWVANADGSDAHEVHDCAAPCEWTDSPAWSPGDTELAMEHGFLVDATTGEGDSTVEVLDLGTGVSRPIYDAAPTEYVYTPRWSPDGSSIAFELDRFDSRRLDAETVVASTIVIADVTGKAKPNPVLPWESWATAPDWHPTKDQLVYVAPTASKDPFGPADVHIVGLDSRDPVRITDFGATGGWAIQPAWTPDGARVIFVGEDKIRTTPNAATILGDGTGLERMAWDGTYRTHPRLRPTP